MTANSRILVVDDDPNILNVMENVLTRNGFSCLAFGHALEALAFLKNNEIDFFLAILDIVMPEMDGIALLKEIQSLDFYKNIPVLFASGLGHEQQIVNAFNLGAVDYIIKPINFNIFLPKVKSFARRHAETRLLANTLIAGELIEKPLDELIAYCENEILNGYLRIEREDGMFGLITFTRGLPDHITLFDVRQKRIAEDTDALDRLLTWQSGNFIVRRGDPIPADEPVSENPPSGDARAVDPALAAASETDALVAFYQHMAKIFITVEQIDEFMILSSSAKVEFVYPSNILSSQPYYRFIINLLQNVPDEVEFTVIKTNKAYYHIMNRLNMYLVAKSSKRLDSNEVNEILANT